MKKTIYMVLFLSIFLLTAGQTFAQTITTAPTVFSTTPQTTGKSASNQQTRITNLQQRADTEIDRRVTSLNNVLSLLNGMKRLSSSVKSTLTTGVQNEINNLTALKTKIDADTDLTTLEADVTSIVNSYRVYLVYIPQIHLLAAADVVNTSATNLTAIASKLQSRIQDAQTAGNNITSLQSSLTDMQSKIQDAQTQSANITSEATPLTPDGYPGNKSIIQTARQNLQTARQDLKTARQDAENILKSLRSFKTSSTTTTISPAATIAPKGVTTTTTTP